MPPTTKHITLDEADELVMDSKYEELLDGDCEEVEDGYVYGLEDGRAVHVSFTGALLVFLPAESTQN